jgi:ComEC/Rec2-related protein
VYISPRVRRPILIIAACLGLLAGAAMAPFAPYALGLAGIVPSVVALVLLRRQSVATVYILVIACFCIGWWRGDDGMRHVRLRNELAHRRVTVVGTATDEAVYSKSKQLEFVITEVRILDPVVAGDGRLVGNITLRGFGVPMVYRGDMVRVTAKFYPTKGNAVAGLSFADITVLQRDATPINEFRRSFAAGMQSALPEPAASFALGILIGQRTTLPEATDEQLRHVGLTHIIAVSGYNLTVIVLACRRLLAGRSKYQATVACTALILVFLLITGTCPPVVRAGIISMLSIAAWYYGREIKPMVLLLLGAAITVAANPQYLWGNVSWYLSFLAFFGVLVLAPLVTRRIWKHREPKLIGGLMVESACATIAVLPYSLFVFGQMSMVSLVANVLVVPLIPLAMLLGLIAGLAGTYLGAISGWLAWPATWILTYVLDVAALLSRVPHAFAEDIIFPWWAMVAAYGLIGYVAVLLRIKGPSRAGHA